MEDLSIINRNAPSFAPGFYFLGQAQLKQGQISEAKKSFAKAIELAPNWLEAILSLAQVNLAAGDSDLALESADKILRVQPTNEKAILIKGTVERQER